MSTERRILSDVLDIAENEGLLEDLYRRLENRGWDSRVIRTERTRHKHLVVRERALAKLSAEERRALGL